MSKLCAWCGIPVVPVLSVAGRTIARQCPLCLAFAPSGKDVGKEPPPKKAPTRAEAKVARKVKAAKAERQLGLFPGAK